MVVGLDGIEKIILAISPSTMKETAFKCIGYNNEGTFVKGELVEIYKPINPVPQERTYKLDELYAVSVNLNYSPTIYIRAGPFERPKYKGLRG